MASLLIGNNNYSGSSNQQLTTNNGLKYDPITGLPIIGTNTTTTGHGGGTSTVTPGTIDDLASTDYHVKSDIISTNKTINYSEISERKYVIKKIKDDITIGKE
jgi:hypothetical protein